ncbi:MAG: type II toxin-antitoxin system VapC family toxin [Burkholderiales bacterium]|nr:type II toxin-antitoxin system VapC family toxin [Burkholderiales bacterium]
MIVIDSSVAMQWVLPEPDGERSRSYLGAPDTTAPDIILIEVANVLAKKVRADQMTADEAKVALSIVQDGIGRVAESAPLVHRSLELSVQLSHPVYDCIFLACAERNGRLATRDAPFMRRLTERGFGHLLEPTL